ncbi:MAG: hypothetical protein AAGD25_06875 [Cyanobacteria bacterium P01_F01_bin.150]
MVFPTGKQIGTGSQVEVAEIPENASQPVLYTITVEAEGTAGAETISLSSDVEFEIRHGQTLTFTGGGTATVNVPASTTLTDVFTITTTAVSVPVLALAATIPAAETATTFAYRKILGATSISVPKAVQSVELPDMDSGFGRTTVNVGNDITVQVQGNPVINDRSMFELLDPRSNDLAGTLLQRQLWVRATLSNGHIHQGPALFVDNGGSNNNREAATYDFSFPIQGNELYSFTSGYTAAFA